MFCAHFESIPTPSSTIGPRSTKNVVLQLLSMLAKIDHCWSLCYNKCLSKRLLIQLSKLEQPCTGPNNGPTNWLWIPLRLSKKNGHLGNIWGRECRCCGKCIQYLNKKESITHDQIKSQFLKETRSAKKLKLMRFDLFFFLFSSVILMWMNLATFLWIYQGDILGYLTTLNIPSIPKRYLHQQKTNYSLYLNLLCIFLGQCIEILRIHCSQNIIFHTKISSLLICVQGMWLKNILSVQYIKFLVSFFFIVVYYFNMTCNQVATELPNSCIDQTQTTLLQDLQETYLGYLLSIQQNQRGKALEIKCLGKHPWWISFLLILINELFWGCQILVLSTVTRLIILSKKREVKTFTLISYVTVGYFVWGIPFTSKITHFISLLYFYIYLFYFFENLMISLLNEVVFGMVLWIYKLRERERESLILFIILCVTLALFLLIKDIMSLVYYLVNYMYIHLIQAPLFLGLFDNGWA
ncbi:hypothetical protein VP01_2322g1 [Puccinia sorghi]|uniref:Uncharacterized protein n=1 Tax=Puccinia sorghi TaxID=27349 RepID=A0A0L6V7N4_9BASI|nr:hypothetical protein VP01_2322g1 [Puccinia sorghi]